MLHGFYPLIWLKVTAFLLSGEFSPAFPRADFISWTGTWWEEQTCREWPLTRRTQTKKLSKTRLVLGP